MCIAHTPWWSASHIFKILTRSRQNLFIFGSMNMRMWMVLTCDTYHFRWFERFQRMDFKLEQLCKRCSYYGVPIIKPYQTPRKSDKRTFRSHRVLLETKSTTEKYWWMNECGDGVALQYKAAFWPSAKDLDNWKKSLTTGHTILKVWFISFVM